MDSKENFSLPIISELRPDGTWAPVRPDGFTKGIYSREVVSIGPSNEGNGETALVEMVDGTEYETDWTSAEVLSLVISLGLHGSPEEEEDDDDSIR